MTGIQDDLSGWCQTSLLLAVAGTQYFVGVEWTDMPLGDQLRYFIPQDAGPYATDSGWMTIESADKEVGDLVGPANETVTTSVTLLYQPATPVVIGPYLGTLTVVPSSPPVLEWPPPLPYFAQWFQIEALQEEAEVQVGAQCDDVPLGGDVRWTVQGVEHDDIPSLDSGWQTISDPNAAITQTTDWPANARAVMGIYYRPSPAAQATAVVGVNADG